MMGAWGPCTSCFSKDGKTTVYFRNMSTQNQVSQMGVAAKDAVSLDRPPAKAAPQRRQINHCGKAMRLQFKAQPEIILPECADEAFWKKVDTPRRDLEVSEVEVGLFEMSWRILPREALVAGVSAVRFAQASKACDTEGAKAEDSAVVRSHVADLQHMLQKCGLLLLPIFHGTQDRKRQGHFTLLAVQRRKMQPDDQQLFPQGGKRTNKSSDLGCENCKGSRCRQCCPEVATVCEA